MLTLDYETGVDGGVERVSVDMGAPRLRAGDIPVRLDRLDDDDLVIDVEHGLGGFAGWPDDVEREPGGRPSRRATRTS